MTNTRKRRAPDRIRPLIELPWRLIGGVVAGLLLLGAAVILHVLEMIRVPGQSGIFAHATELTLGGAGGVLLLVSLAGFLRKAREDERTFREIVENSTNVFYSHTPDHEVTYVSPRIGQVLGVDPQQVPQRWTDFVTDHPVNAEGLAATRRAVETGERQPPYELELAHADGHPVRVKVTETPVMRDGKTVAIVGSLTDVTEVRKAEEERHRMEEQLRQAQKMEAVGQLTGGIAHDFNNHLTVILTNSALLADHVDETGRGFVDEIRTAGSRSAELVKKLLAFARREALDLRELRAHDLFQDYRSLVRRLLPESIELKMEAAPDLPPVKADPTALGQILLNLAANARDAMLESGTLEISARRKSIRQGHLVMGERVAPGDYLSIRVSDTGSGMPAHVRDRVFDPFFTTKANGEGTGLGLSMVHGLVRQHGGHTWIDSAEGKGTTVEILLPTAPEEASRAGGEDRPEEDAPERERRSEDALERERSGEARSDGARKDKARTEEARREDGRPEGEAHRTEGEQKPERAARILLVDDDPVVRRATRRVLERAGYEVLTAEDGREALETVRSRATEIDLVITDVVMPAMGGMELCQAVTSTAPDLPFLFVSGYSAEDRARTSVAASRGTFFSKPWTPAELLAAVQDLLQRRGAEAGC